MTALAVYYAPHKAYTDGPYILGSDAVATLSLTTRSIPDSILADSELVALPARRPFFK